MLLAAAAPSVDLPAQAGRQAALSALSIIAAAVLLAAPALWNGFPLLYWDSFDYIVMPFTGEVPPFRTVSYTIFTIIGSPLGTLWAPIALQCLLAAFILHEVLAAFAPIRARIVLVPVVMALVLFTALPWFTSQLMADAMTGVLVLGMAALAFGPAGQGRIRRLGLVLALAVAVAVHTTHLALSAGLVLAFLGLRALAWLGAYGWLSARIILPALVVCLGAGLATGANWLLTGRVFVSQSTANLMLARLVEDGIAQKYLALVCPQGAPLRLCAARERLPHDANEFLWLPGPFYELGGWTSAEMRKEAAFIVAGSLRLLPWEHVRSAVALTVQQLAMVQTGDGIIRLDTIYGEESAQIAPFMPKAIGSYYPGDLAAYWASRQRGTLDFTPINIVQVPVAFAGYAAVLVVLGWSVRRRDRLAAGLALTVVLTILGNAIVCGALSNPNHRYQARIAWTALFAAGIGMALLSRPKAHSIAVAPHSAALGG